MQVALTAGGDPETRRNRVIEITAIAALVFIFILDIFTPAELAVEVAYEVPVAMGGLTGSRKAILRLSIFAAFLTIAGYVADSLQSTFSNTIAIENRIISIASLTLVCTLMIVVQRAASNNARLEEERRLLVRERALGREIELRNEKLLERQALIEELTETIAHDVRTPLAALSLTLKQALRGQYGPLPEGYREIALESRTSIDDIARLADTLLAVARFEAGAATPDVAPVNLRALARELASEFSPLAQQRGLTLTTAIPGDATVAAGEPDVRRALGNLVANAIRHTPPSGRIEVIAERSAIGWRLDVRDSGVGVPLDAVPELFERYASGGSGTGLGLHIVRRIAECFGGTATYRPLEPHGACFSIDLPAVKR